MSAIHEKDAPSHFKGKDAIAHVVEAQAQGIISSSEVHGTEVPGHISALADAARESAVVLLLLWTVLIALNVPHYFTVLAIVSVGWTIWKCGRSSWLGWSRLERLHRVLEQERYEILHHRQQERSELKELYAVKGFEGKLLEDVLDVLMADDNRLLRVMVEEELGLSLHSHEHPLKQGLGAFVGCLVATLVCLAGNLIYPAFGIVIAALIIIGGGAAISAYHARNRLIPAIVWNFGIGALSFGSVYFLLDYFFLQGK
jgi:vacuolar iron transporter family protein